MIAELHNSIFDRKIVLKLFAVFFLSMLLSNLSVANEKESVDSMEDKQNDTVFITNSNCNTIKDIELRVYHSLYTSKEDAELAYKRIVFSVDKAEQLNLLNQLATKDSLDAGSRINGGDLGYIYYGFLDNTEGELNKAIYELPLDTLSFPVRSEFGWHLFWVSEARDINTKNWCTHSYWIQ